MIIVPRDEKENSLDRLYRIRDKFKEEYKDTTDIGLMIEVLEKDDETLLDKMSLEGCAYFFKIVDYKYYYEIFVGLLYEIFESDNDDIKTTYISSNLIPSKLLNEDSFLELILKQNDEILESFRYYKFDNTSLDVLCKILNRMNNIDCNFFKIQCDSKKSFIAQNADYSTKIVESDNFVNDSKYIESIYLKKMLSNSKDSFLKFSINDIINIVDRIDNKKIQKEFFDFFDLKKYPDKITKNLVSLLDRDTILEKISNGEYEYISYLTNEEQLQLLNKEEVNHDYISTLVNDDVIIANLSINPKIVPLSVYLKVYNNGRSIKIEEYIKNVLSEINILEGDMLILGLIDSTIIKSYSEEEINNLVSKIKCIDNPLLFFNLTKINNVKFYNGVIEYILNNYDFENNNRIKLSLSELSRYPQEYREKILLNLDKSYLVYTSLVNDKEFKLLVELLNWDNKYLENVIFESIPTLKIKDESYDKKYKILKEYLNLEQLSTIFFSCPKMIETSKVIRNDFISLIKKDTSKLKDISLVKYLPQSMQNEILNNLPINTFIESIPSDFNKYFDTSIIDGRYDEIVKYVNLHNVMVYTIPLIYNLFSDENKNKFISDVPFSFAFYIYKNHIKNKVDKKRVFRKIFGTKDKLIDFDNNTFNYLDMDELEIFNDISYIGNIVRASIISNNNYLIQNLMGKIKKDFSILLDPNVYIQIDSLTSLLSDEEINYIKDNCIKKLEKYSYYLELNDKENLTLGSMLSMLYGLKKGYICDTNIPYLNKIYSQDKNIFAYLDCRVLRSDIYSLGDKFISKIIRYPHIVNEIYSIANTDKYNSLKNIILYLNDLDIKDEVYCIVLEMILIFYNNNTSINSDNPKALIDYIISSNMSSNKLISKLKFDNNYLESKEKIINYWIEKNTDLDELKDLVYEKIYGISSSSIKDVINRFKVDYNLVKEYISDNLVNIYISIQESIEELENIDELHKFCKEVKTRYTVMDYFKFIDCMKKAYSKLIEKQNSEIKPNSEIRNITIDNNSVEVEEYIDNFGIFTHNTSSYIDNKDDYYISWNNTNNNGINTSYITNSNMGCYPNTDSGVLFGFNDITSQSIGLYAPYNLNTINNSFGLFSSPNEYYVSLNNLSSYTRFKHNEIVLYKRINNINILPSCVVIFEDMDDSIKINSLKAVNDFKNHGVNLKIVYIDRNKVISNEVIKLAHSIKEYLNSYDLDLLETILNKYNTNISSLDYLDNVDINELFITKSIKELLTDTVEHIISINDNNVKSGEIIRFIDIINNELYKYEILNQNIEFSDSKFELYDQILDGQIKELEKILVSSYRKRIGLKK